MKFHTYHNHEPRRLKSNLISDNHPFIISNRNVVSRDCSLINTESSMNPNESSTVNDHFKYNMLPYHVDLPNICYELGDGSDKEVERIEHYYGGRLRAQRAARIIQNAYRDYRLRAEYARLRFVKGNNRNTEVQTSEVTVQNKDKSNQLSMDDSSGRSCLKSGRLYDVDDLVIDRAYMDWSLEATVNEIESNNSLLDGTYLADDKDAKYCSQWQQSHTKSVSQSPDVSNIMSNKYLSPDIVESHVNKKDFSRSSVPNSSVQFDNNIQSSRRNIENNSGRQLTNLQTQLNSPPLHNFNPYLKLNVNNSCEGCCCCCCSSHQTNFNHYVCNESIPKAQVLSPTEIDSSTHNGHCFQKCCLPTRIPNHRSIQNTCPYCMCFPTMGSITSNKSPTLVCLPASRNTTMVPPCNSNPCPAVISYPISKVCKTPPSIVPSCPPLNTGLLHFNSRHIMPTTASLIVPTQQMESLKLNNNNNSTNNNESFQRHHPNHMSCRNQCPHIDPTNSCRLRLHHSYFPYTIPNQAIPSSLVNPYGFKNPCLIRIPSAQEKRRKRTYRIGLNIFNKSPVKGIDFLIKNGFLENSPQLVARFLLTRKGLSRVAIGDYLGNTKNELAKLTTQQFIRELDFRNQEVDEALRLLLSCFRTPGESQKIVHLLNEFQTAYVEQNATRVKTQFRSSDTVMILAYAIVMLHTDMYSPNVRQQSKMTRDEFIRNLRGVDSGEDLDRDLLIGIYNRMKSKEMSVQSDHTDQVRKIQQHLTGPLKPLNLSVPQRRLVCYCRLYEVPDKNKRERSGAHQRELFLFNDLLLITKAVQKRRKDAAVAYQVRMTIQLLGVKLVPFETIHHTNGLELLLPLGQTTQSIDSQKDNNSIIVETPNGRARILATFNTKTASDRARLMEDLQECILEVTEMERLRMEEISKQKYNHTHHHHHCYKSRVDGGQLTKCDSGGGGGHLILDKSSSSFDSSTSVHNEKSVGHHKYDCNAANNPLHMCAPITCLTNSTDLNDAEHSKHIVINTNLKMVND
uniref:SEC7 domain-containing protein n=1 Tax=Trichobilharzia regenti TaxID=157069 RepID=A0AA85KEH4_TRIRE|nr:unnamed protein product [Trichobilharzia regenti]